MNFIETGIEDLYVVELNKIGDERGFFARAWCEKEFSDQYEFAFNLMNMLIAFRNKIN